MIKLNINLSAIPKEKIFNGKKGKYLTIITQEMKQPDSYGNTHTVFIEQTKEEREAKAEKIYIGKGKETTFSGSANNNSTKEEENSDLPF